MVGSKIYSLKWASSSITVPVLLDVDGPLLAVACFVLVITK